MTRQLMYLMHPVGNGPDREKNRWLACQWQAAIQADHPEWLVLAPWIGLTGAWSEERREMGLAVDFATIDVCDGGIVTGVTTGLQSFGGFEGVSPGMALELKYFSDAHPGKHVHDLRGAYDIQIPRDWLPARVVPTSEFRPRFEAGEKVVADGKHGRCTIVEVKETAPGVFYYLVEEKTRFQAHEQSLRKDAL